MKLFVENIPSFYRTRHVNQVAKRISVGMIYTEAMEKETTRNDDFFKGDFDYETLFLKGSWLNKYKQVKSFLSNKNVEEVIICGWNCLAFWLLAFMSPRKNNSCIVESSIYECKTTGLKALIKKIFLSRIHKAYPAGKAQTEVLKRLGFKGEIVESGGCGILNYMKQPFYEERKVVKRFLYVGRFIELKNLKLLIGVFNQFPHLELELAGFGEQDEELKSLAGSNVKFLGAVNNIDLWKVYREADVFVLPSRSEPWGLVVEEALNNGTPVIVSDKVGCREDLVTKETGLVFKFDDTEDLKQAVVKMCNVDFYNKLRMGVSKLDFAKRAQHQVDVFLE